MQATLSVDGNDWELEETIKRLKDYIRYDMRAGFDAEIPLDLYTKLEEFGVDIEKLLIELELEINGESDVHDSDWGC